jgi:hypothetical protein
MHSFSERSELLFPQQQLLSANIRQGICHSLCDTPTSDEFEVGGRSGVAGFDVAQLLSGDFETAEIAFTDEHGTIDGTATGDDDLPPTMGRDRLR